MALPSIEELKEALRNGDVCITFIKKDGTEREMTCTTCLDMIPEDHHPTMPVPTPEHLNDFIRVYDLGAKGWRSFYYHKLTDVII